MQYSNRMVPQHILEDILYPKCWVTNPRHKSGELRAIQIIHVADSHGLISSKYFLFTAFPLDTCWMIVTRAEESESRPELEFDTCWMIVTRAAESESRPELEFVRVDRFAWNRSRSWSRKKCLLRPGVAGYHPLTENHFDRTVKQRPETLKEREEKESVRVEMELKRHF